MNYRVGGNLAIDPAFASANGISSTGPLAVNLAGAPPPTSFQGFQFLEASGGGTGTKAFAIGYYPGPNGTISGANNPIVNRLSNLTTVDFFDVVSSPNNHTIGPQIPDDFSEGGYTRITFPFIAGSQMIDTPVDIWAYFSPSNTGAVIFVLPVGGNPSKKAIYRLFYFVWGGLSTPASSASIYPKSVEQIDPGAFNFTTGTLRSLFLTLRSWTQTNFPPTYPSYTCSVFLYFFQEIQP